MVFLFQGRASVCHWAAGTSRLCPSACMCSMCHTTSFCFSLPLWRHHLNQTLLSDAQWQWHTNTCSLSQSSPGTYIWAAPAHSVGRRCDPSLALRRGPAWSGDWNRGVIGQPVSGTEGAKTRQSVMGGKMESEERVESFFDQKTWDDSTMREPLKKPFTWCGEI